MIGFSINFIGTEISATKVRKFPQIRKSLGQIPQNYPKALPQPPPGKGFQFMVYEL